MNNYKNSGFTLLETLIAFLVLTIGLLGAVALQAKAKQASYDSLQRAAALSLSKDIIQRISINDDIDSIENYTTAFSSNYSESTSSFNCINVICSPDVMVNYDIEEWKKQIKAKENTGILADARVCITLAPVPVVLPAVPSEFNIEVIVSWEGRQKIIQSDANAQIDCGTASETRKIVVVNSFVSVRG